MEPQYHASLLPACFYRGTVGTYPTYPGIHVGRARQPSGGRAVPTISPCNQKHGPRFGIVYKLDACQPGPGSARDLVSLIIKYRISSRIPPAPPSRERGAINGSLNQSCAGQIRYMIVMHVARNLTIFTCLLDLAVLLITVNYLCAQPLRKHGMGC